MKNTQTIITWVAKGENRILLSGFHFWSNVSLSKEKKYFINFSIIPENKIGKDT